MRRTTRGAVGAAIAGGTAAILLVSGTQLANAQEGTAGAPAPSRQAFTSGLQVKAVAPKAVRKLRFSLDSGANLGTNVSGYVTLADVLPSVAIGLPGVPVVVQQLKGAKYVIIADGVTDESGSMPVSFLAQTNMTLRAVAKPFSGKSVSSAPFKFSTHALVSWSARPTMSPTVNVPAPYSFRINPAAGAKGQLQWAVKAAKPKWKVVKVSSASAEGVVTQSIRFAKPGTYLVRGASLLSPTNAVGTTTAIEVEVSAG